MSQEVTLFVYGTLKRAGRNHHLIKGGRFLGEVRTLPWYRMVDCGNYPAIVLDLAAGSAISGELFIISRACIADLDAFEGVPDLFVRRTVALDPIREGDVQAYFYRRDTSGFAVIQDCWTSWSGSMEVEQLA